MIGTNFRRTVDLFVARTTTGAQIQGYLADQALGRINELIRSGEASPNYRLFTNNVLGADPRTIKLDGTGQIEAVFSNLADAALFAYNYAVKISPVGEDKPGEIHYKDAWYFIVNGQPWTSSLDNIPPLAEVVLTNNRDYARKIDVGGQRMSVRPQIIEQVRQKVMQKFPGIIAERKFITIPGGYILRGHSYRSGISYDKKRRIYIRLHPRKQTRRSDTRKGEAMTYPSLFLTEEL
jgi:hypothetical protein